MCAYCIFLLFVYSVCSFSTFQILLVGSFDLSKPSPV